MKGKRGRFTTIHRALQLLYLLESKTPGDTSITTASTPSTTDSSNEPSVAIAESSSEPGEVADGPSTPPETTRRPVRKAAQRSERSWRNLIQELEDDEV